jgi:hypothetical protein
MDWIKEKNNIFNEIYLKLFLENDFKKRGWEFYKVLEQNKLAVTVKIHSSGYNDEMSAAFWVLIGIKFNKNYPEKLKMSEIKLENCEVQFSIIQILYPAEDIELGEYWYRIGEIYDDKLGKEIGSTKKWSSQYHGYKEGKKEQIQERISEKYIKFKNREYDKKSKLIDEKESIRLDTDNRYDSNNAKEIFLQIQKDTEQILHFVNKLSDMNSFIQEDTTGIISNEVKKEIIHNYCE